RKGAPESKTTRAPTTCPPTPRARSHAPPSRSRSATCVWHSGPGKAFMSGNTAYVPTSAAWWCTCEERDDVAPSERRAWFSVDGEAALAWGLAHEPGSSEDEDGDAPVQRSAAARGAGSSGDVTERLGEPLRRRAHLGRRSSSARRIRGEYPGRQYPGRRAARRRPGSRRSPNRHP